MQLRVDDVLPVYGLVNLSTNEWLRLRDLHPGLSDDLVLFMSWDRANQCSQAHALDFAPMPLTPYQISIYGLEPRFDGVELIQAVK